MPTVDQMKALINASGVGCREFMAQLMDECRQKYGTAFMLTTIQPGFSVTTVNYHTQGFGYEEYGRVESKFVDDKVIVRMIRK